jgi:hypothetical protein
MTRHETVQRCSHGRSSEMWHSVLRHRGTNILEEATAPNLYSSTLKTEAVDPKETWRHIPEATTRNIHSPSLQQVTKVKEDVSVSN